MACIRTPVLGMYIYGQSFSVFPDIPCTESFQVCKGLYTDSCSGHVYLRAVISVFPDIPRTESFHVCKDVRKLFAIEKPKLSPKCTRNRQKDAAHAGSRLYVILMDLMKSYLFCSRADFIILGRQTCVT